MHSMIKSSIYLDCISLSIKKEPTTQTANPNTPACELQARMPPAVSLAKRKRDGGKKI